jgi:hypothetical protein
MNHTDFVLTFAEVRGLARVEATFFKSEIASGALPFFEPLPGLLVFWMTDASKWMMDRRNIIAKNSLKIRTYVPRLTKLVKAIEVGEHLREQQYA